MLPLFLLQGFLYVKRFDLVKFMVTSVYSCLMIVTILVVIKDYSASPLDTNPGCKNNVKITGTCKYSCKTKGYCLGTIVNILVISKTFYATSPRCVQGILPRM